MSGSSLDIVRGCFEAYLRGDNEAALAAFDPEVEFDQTIRPEGQIYHGPSGVAEALRTWTGTFENWSVEVHDFVEAGDRVLVIGRQSGRGKGSGVEIDRPFFHLVTVRSGKIVHWKAYPDREQAFEAAGLPLN